MASASTGIGRAIRFCVQRAERALHQVASASNNPRPHNQAERELGRLRAELEFGVVDEVLELGLHKWVDAFQTKLNRVGTAIDETFFALGSPERLRQSQSQG